MHAIGTVLAALMIAGNVEAASHARDAAGHERQCTKGPGGRILTNTGVWSPDGEWIVYDTRSDAAGDVFDGSRIELVHVRTGQVKVVYESRNGAHCGVVTFHPREPKVVFILGPENPSADWQYAANHRQGVVVDVSAAIRVPSGTQPFSSQRLDARDIVPPFTPGALRGGSHVHVWDAQGDWVSFTYNDAVYEPTIRDVGVSVPNHSVKVPATHPRNHDGEYFSVLVTRTVAEPRPGSDEIGRAFEEAWIGTNGYVRADGTRQKRALAFQGHVKTEQGTLVSELFVVDLPEDLTRSGDGPLAGTPTTRPTPPRGVTQRRITFTAGRKFPGLQGPRHWLRSSPAGDQIAFLMKDDAGVVQLWSVSPHGGAPRQITTNHWPIASAFTWSADGKRIAHVMDNSVCITDVTTGKTQRITERSPDALAPRPEACVFSPDGRQIAFVRRIAEATGTWNQICVGDVP